MKIAAIIAEYNPFHKGHQFQIEETRRLTGADYVLVVMSGDFVQRGAPALCNKYLRTKMALLGGADVVLELPSLFATSSAEYFAQGGVTLLNKLGVIDYLSFGSECGDIQLIINCAKQLLSSTEQQEQQISDLVAKGLSYPLARQQVLLEALPAENDTFASTADAIKALLSTPNNILGLEYCKSLLALNSNIEPVTIRRKGSEYHENTLSEDNLHFASASAIRHALNDNSADYLCHLPDTVATLFKEHQILDTFITEDDFSLLLYYKLLSEQNAGFTGYLDCSEELSFKIKKYLPEYRSFSQFCDLLKSKNLTYTRISRTLLHILLNVKTPIAYSAPMQKRALDIPYARLLGFRKDASGVLSAIKKNSSIPLISNIADATALLSEEGVAMLLQDIYACDVYEAVFSQKAAATCRNGCDNVQKKEPLNEYKQSPVIV